LAQAPDTLWTKRYGRSGPDRAYAIQPAIDSGYVIVGTTFTPDPICNYDIYLLKIDDQGDTAWTEVFGGAYDDGAYAISQTSDGGYVITGYTNTGAVGNNDVYIVKTDSDGDTLWTRAYGGSEDDRGYGIQETSDGGFVIVGHKNINYRENIYLIKTDMWGDTVWTREYGGQFEDYGRCVLQNLDGGYTILGYTDVAFGCQEYAIWLLKTDSIGDTLWTKIYSPFYYDERGYAMQRTTDGSYIITGCALVSGHLWDLLVMKIDASGDTLWKRISGSQPYEYGYSVQETHEGGYIVTGIKRPSPGDYDIYLERYDVSGNTIWTKVLGGTADDESQAIVQTADFGYLIVGYTESFGASNADVYIVKLAPDPYGVADNREVDVCPIYLEISPNPFRNIADIRYQITDDSKDVELRIYDITGREVKDLTGLVSAIGHRSSVGWSGVDDANRLLRSGIYFVRLKAGDYCITEKVLLLR
jgi:hypothetical protein